MQEYLSSVNNLNSGSVVSIIGGGLSGVEFASELNESRQDLKISVFDRGNRILSAFPVRLSTYVENWFDNHGVEMISNSNITRVEESVLYNHEEPFLVISLYGQQVFNQTNLFVN